MRTRKDKATTQPSDWWRKKRFYPPPADKTTQLLWKYLKEDQFRMVLFQLALAEAVVSAARTVLGTVYFWRQLEPDSKFTQQIMTDTMPLQRAIAAYDAAEPSGT